MFLLAPATSLFGYQFHPLQFHRFQSKKQRPKSQSLCQPFPKILLKKTSCRWNAESTAEARKAPTFTSISPNQKQFFSCRNHPFIWCDSSWLRCIQPKSLVPFPQKCFPFTKPLMPAGVTIKELDVVGETDRPHRQDVANNTCNH